MFSLYKQNGKVFKTIFTSEGESSITLYSSRVAEQVRLKVKPPERVALQKILDAGKNQKEIKPTPTRSSELEPVGDGMWRGKLSAHRLLKEMNVQWSTEQILIDDKMVEEFDAERKAEKAALKRKEEKENRTRKKRKVGDGVASI